MPTLTIGGHTVTVGDDFLSLPPEQRDATINEIAQKLNVSQKFEGSVPVKDTGFSATKMLANVPSSAMNAGKDIAAPFIHPVETAESLANLGRGALQKMGFLSGTEYEKYPEAVGQFLVERYGSTDKALKSLQDDPVGVAMDLSTVLTGGGSLVAKAPGVVGKVGELAKTAGAVTDPLKALGAAAKGTANLGKFAFGGTFAPAATARADVARALARDEMTPEQAAKQAADGKVLPDVGGENTKGLLERVAQTPGAGRTIATPFLTDRQAQQAARISADLSSLTGTDRTAYQAVTQTMEGMKKAATPLYNAAYQAGDHEIWSPELERLSSSPTIKSAMQGAVRIWQDNAVADGFGAMNPSSVDRGGILKFGKSVPVFPNIQFWDYTKRIIDDKISQAVRAGQNQKVRTLTALNSQLRTALDASVPEYRAARAAWEGPSKYLDAIEEGRNILSKNVSSEELAANFREMTENQKSGFLVGAVSSIIGKMGGDPAKLGDMTKYLRSPEMIKKLIAIMPNERAARAWAERLKFEIQSSELTGRALRGSPTARRLAEQSDAKSIVGDLVFDAFTGAHGSSLIRRIVSAGPKWLRDTLRSRADKEIARILTSPAALKSLPAVLSGGVLPERGTLTSTGRAALSKVPLRAAGQAGFQTGRLDQIGAGAFGGMQTDLDQMVQ